MLLEMMERSCSGQKASQEEHFALVKAEHEVVGRFPFRDVNAASTDVCFTQCTARGKGKVRLRVISVTMVSNIIG